MFGQIRKALKEISDGRYVEAYVGIGLACIAVIVNVVSAFVNPAGIATVIASTTTVALLGVITFATIELRRDLPKAAQFKLMGFFANRSMLPPLRSQIEGVRQEIWMFALQLGQVSHDILPQLEERAREGCKIHLAVVSPVDVNGDRIPWIDALGLTHNFANLDQLVRANIQRLRQWMGAELEANEKANVQIRAYTDLPTAAVIIYDPQLRQGFIQIEPILYRFNPSLRPNIWLSRSNDPGLYDLCLRRYRELWDRAIPIDQLKI